jgi:hypothetical protein
MQTRTVAILTVRLAIAVFLSAGPLAAQTLPSPTCTPNLFTIPKGSRGHEVANEVYAPSVTAAVYLVNFLLLYMANPDLAAYMPAYRAPIPQPVVDCLEQNPMGCTNEWRTRMPHRNHLPRKMTLGTGCAESERADRTRSLLVARASK